MTSQPQVRQKCKWKESESLYNYMEQNPHPHMASWTLREQEINVYCVKSLRFRGLCIIATNITYILLAGKNHDKRNLGCFTVGPSMGPADNNTNKKQTNQQKARYLIKHVPSQFEKQST